MLPTSSDLIDLPLPNGLADHAAISVSSPEDPDSLLDEFAHVEELSRHDVAAGLWLECLNVAAPSRNRGIGSAIMKHVCALADADARCLFLQAYPLDVDATHADAFWLGRERLVQFYQRFGFTHAGQGWMFRRPKS